MSAHLVSRGNSSRRFGVALRSACVIASLVASTAWMGCGSAGHFTWYTQLPRSEWGSDAGEYVIGPGDVLTISVYQQSELTTKAKVRSDGKVALTFVGELSVAGKRPAVLAQELEVRLRQFIVSPRVIVNVEESHPIAISVLGEVGNKGNLTLEPPATLLQALAQAGGLSEYANDDKIFVLRRIPSFRRIRFTYKAIVNNEAGAAMFPLRNGDVIIVE